MTNTVEEELAKHKLTDKEIEELQTLVGATYKHASSVLDSPDFPIVKIDLEIAKKLLFLAKAQNGLTPSSRWFDTGHKHRHADRYDCERTDLIWGHLTDDEMANAVFMEPSMSMITGAKDRIRWLSRKLIEVTKVTLQS